MDTGVKTLEGWQMFRDFPGGRHIRDYLDAWDIVSEGLVYGIMGIQPQEGRIYVS